HDVRVDEGAQAVSAEASHDGYRHLKGRPVPHRRFTLNEGAFIVEDSLTPPREAQAHYHLHPAIEVVATADDAATLALPGGTRLQIRTTGGALRCEPATWHPEFGVSQATHRL